MDTNSEVNFVPPVMHIGRSWEGHRLEDECPCPQEPCGLVSTDNFDEDCPQHGFMKSKTMRQGHYADRCLSVVLENKVIEALNSALSEDALVCTRVWEAWSHGTMTANDFEPLIEQEEFMREIAKAAIQAVKDGLNYGD